MRKVTTINLDNNAYQMDEAGFDALRAYLDYAEQALAGNPDRAEILADLEQAIAEKCRLALGAHKNVVNAAEMERILAEMGPVASGVAEAAPGDATPLPDMGTAGAARGRRLYRLRAGQKLTGVCSGLGAYAGIDVTWVRVAFVLLTIFGGGFGLLAYLVLVFVMPIATTPEEIAMAHGQPVNAQELVDRAKKKVMDGAKRAGLVAG